MPEYDLVALVVELRALMPTVIDNHMGRAVQRIGWELLSQYDATLGSDEHDKNDQKPFTASGLMRGNSLFYGLEVKCYPDLYL